MRPTRLIIAGSRSFDDYEYLKESVDNFISLMLFVGDIEIVSGTARGADRLGERYAKEKGYILKKFPADWRTHGRSAGYRRNIQMAEYSDALCAFWDRESSGTKHMINVARGRNLRVMVFPF